MQGSGKEVSSLARGAFGLATLAPCPAPHPRESLAEVLGLRLGVRGLVSWWGGRSDEASASSGPVHLKDGSLKQRGSQFAWAPRKAPTKALECRSAKTVLSFSVSATMVSYKAGPWHIWTCQRAREHQGWTCETPQNARALTRTSQLGGVLVPCRWGHLARIRNPSSPTSKAIRLMCDPDEEAL